jgi:hypothetical protein
MVRHVTGAISVLAAAGYLTAFPASPAAAPAVRTTTSLTAWLNPTATVTLMAAVSAADGSVPAGAVQFEAGGADIGSPVAVTSGRATTTASVTAETTPVTLTAVFTAASSGYLSSAGGYAETLSHPAGAQSLAGVAASGTFTVTIASGTVNLTVSGLTATGTLEDITVTDTRSDSPGWSVSGQDSGFTGSGTAAGRSISGDQLGWAPAAVGALQGGATLGGTVAPVSPGLGSSAAVLAAAAPGCGAGTNVLSASLTLAIPPSAAAGPYSGTLTITYVAAGPQNQTCPVV